MIKSHCFLLGLRKVSDKIVWEIKTFFSANIIVSKNFAL
jgi:hypothetical protein